MSSNSIYANAISQVEPPTVGVHLLWAGPHTWTYSVNGWFVQRRKVGEQRAEKQCANFNSNDIAQLQKQREKLLSFGSLTLEEGIWPSQILTITEKSQSTITTRSSDTFVLELNEARSKVQIQLQAESSFVIGMRSGKAIITVGPRSGPTTYELHTTAIDTVMVYTLSPSELRFCIYIPVGSESDEWKNVPFVLEGLQIPLQGLNPTIGNSDAEFIEAKNRLLSGETLDEDEFKNLANIMRVGLLSEGPTRPIDRVLRMREDVASDFIELAALDPLLVLLSHPKWRRVLGFSWFDNDPSLEVGESYEYRITGSFPSEDLNDTVYSFHKVPSQTALPSEFYLGNLRIRLPQPVTVKLSPDTSNQGLIQISRRGIDIHPLDQPFWSLPSLEDWSLVIDFASPIQSVILELHEGHILEYSWGNAWSLFSPPQSIPAGQKPRLDFPFPVQQLRIRGSGFLYAIRVPKGLSGLMPISIVLPPITLVNSPRPEAPIMAWINNLQQFESSAASDTVTGLSPGHKALGFEIRWRPALSGGLSIWPPGLTVPPPLNSTLFQIEHREMSPDPSIQMQMLPNLLQLGDKSYWPAISGRVDANPSSGSLRNEDNILLPDEKNRRLASGILNRDIKQLQSLLFIPTTSWTPLLQEENWIMGNRDEGNPDNQIFPGVDLMILFPDFPRHSAHSGLDIFWWDVFDFPEGDNVVIRPVPSPGTYHQYRITTIDTIGRSSLGATETNVLRLEKRVPPPLPVGPEDNAQNTTILPVPTGVQARVLVRDAPDLTSDDLVTIGTDSNVIILRWGWHSQQRDQDPLAREFRLYIADRPLDSVSGMLTSTMAVGQGIFEVTLELDRSVPADAAKGSNLQAGYPFYVRTHTAGGTITARLEAHVPDASGNLPQPSLGHIILPLHMVPNMTRPPAWSERVGMRPITLETQYETILRNRLDISADHPYDSIWVGVSTADDQSYVSDQLEPIETRPGNESAIVPVICTARYHGRPVFSIPPNLEHVPVLVTPEPNIRPLIFTLDLSPYTTDFGLSPSDLIRPERASADIIFSSCAVSVDGRIMGSVIDRRNNAEVDSEIVVPNPNDQNAIISALTGARTDELEDRFVVFLAGSHPYRDRLFEPATEAPIPSGPFQETLQAQAGRYVYLVRKADAAGHISSGGAVAKVIVHVPSLAPGAAPERSPPLAGDVPGTLRLRVQPEKEITHLLTFDYVRQVGSPIDGNAELLRVPNAHHLYPTHGIQLRLASGILLGPRVKALSDADVTVDSEGYRQVRLVFNAGAGERVQVWACTITKDGILSILAGPWGLPMPIAPLPIPVLTVLGVLPNLVFNWMWPQSLSEPRYNVSIEQSQNGTNWVRISAPLPETATTYSYTQALDNLSYRLRVMSPDGRSAYSNTVIR